MNSHTSPRDDALLRRGLAALPDAPGICPDANVLAGFVEGRLIAHEMDTTVAHLARCNACRGIVARAASASRSHHVLGAVRRFVVRGWGAIAAAAAAAVLAWLAWDWSQPSTEARMVASADRLRAAHPDLLDVLRPLTPAERLQAAPELRSGPLRPLWPSGAVFDPRPTFRWEASAGFGPVLVTLHSVDGATVLSTLADGTTLAYPAAAPDLVASAEYEWRIAHPSGSPRAERAFTVADDVQRERFAVGVRAIRAAAPADLVDLLCAHFALRCAVLDEAEAAARRAVTSGAPEEIARETLYQALVRLGAGEASAVLGGQPRRRSPRRRRRRRRTVRVALALALVTTAPAQDPPGPARLQELVAAAQTQASAGDPVGAADVYRQARELAVVLAPPDDETTCDTFVAFVRLALDFGDLDGAQTGCDRILAGRPGKQPARDPHAQWVHRVQGWILGTRGDHAGLVAHWERIVDDFGRALPPGDPTLLQARLQLCNPLAKVGRLREAVVLAEDALAGLERQIDDEHPALAEARALVAMVLSTNGNATRSVELYERALATFERAVPPQPDAVEGTRVQLAVTLAQTGDLHRALGMFEAVLEARGRRFPRGHPQILEVQQHLMAVAGLLGDTRRALALGEEVLSLRAAAGPPDHPDVLNACVNLASLRRDLGDAAGAERLLQRAARAWADSASPDPQRLAWTLTALATTRFDAGDAAAARPLLERARALQVDALPEGHPEALHTSLVLALVLVQTGAVEAGRELARGAVDAFERTHASDWEGLYTMRANLAQIEGRTGDHEAALRLQELPPQLVALGDAHPMVTRGRARLGATLLALGDLPRARVELAAALHGLQQECATAAALVAPAVVEGNVARLAVPVSEYLSTGVHLTEEADHVADLEYVVGARGFAERHASRAAAVRAAAGRSDDVRRLLAAANAVRSRAHALRGAGAGAREQQAALEAVIAADEDLSRALAAEGAAWPAVPFDSNALRAALPPDGAALLTVTWGLVSPAGAAAPLPPVTACVSAFVITAAGVRRIDLGDASRIEKAASALRHHLRHGNEGRVAAAARTLDDHLRPALAAVPTQTRELLVCPDGALATVPWELLPYGAHDLLGDRMRLTYCDNLTSPGHPHAELAAPSLLVVGDVDYETAIGAGPVADVPAPGPAFRGEAHTYPPLPGAREEIDAALRAFRAAFPSARSEAATGRAATRGHVAARAPGFRFLHLATHAEAAADAFWRPETAQQPSPESLARRGLLARLVLAGANATPVDGIDAAMLSAAELAELDLSACELAVLSACDTHAGDRWFGEALAGLNRAMHIAGARHTITSLWKVRDDGARVFFAAFYEHLWSGAAAGGLRIADALAHARAATRARGFGPEVWACFVHYGEFPGR